MSRGIEIIDSHSHPQFRQYNADRDEVIKRSLDSGVAIICVGTDLEMSKKAIELAEKYENVWASVGIHPNDVNFQFSPASPRLGRGRAISNFQTLLNQPKVVAIGEVGLDYYRTVEPERQELQRKIFREFLQLAKQLKKPIIVHSRQAFKDTYGILSEFKGLKAVIHSFTYSFEEAQKFFDLGFYIGLNGIITFTRPNPALSEKELGLGGRADQLLNEVVKNVPLDRILLETDAPFLAPVPNRGKRNEPLWVKFVAEHIAKVKSIAVEEASRITLENTKRLFGI